MSKGSPVPMTTTFPTFSPVSLSMEIIWSAISPTVRFLCSPLIAEAQKPHPIRQPAWDEMQTVFPNLYFINTVSMELPSFRPNKYFLVPSFSEL